MGNLKIGFAWSLFSAVSRQGLMMLGTIILARLLTPDDYGLLGMLSIFIVVSETIIDAGLGGALIRKQNVQPIDFETLTVYNLAASIGLYLIIFLISPLVAEFYKKDILVQLLRLYGLTVVIEAFSIVPKILMMKNLYFKKYAISNFISGACGLSGAILLAYNGSGVYSLIFQYIITASIFLLLSVFFTKYRFHFAFSMTSFKELFGFGFNTTLGNIIKNFTEGLFSSVYAKVAPLANVGYFNQSTRIQNSVFSLQNTIIESFVYPVLCKELSNVKEQSQKINEIVSLGVVALNTWLILNSQEIINIVLGAQWLPMDFYFRILLLAGICQSQSALNRNLLKTIDRTKNIVFCEVASTLFAFLILTASLASSSFESIIYSFLLYSLFRFIVYIYYVLKFEMITIRSYILSFAALLTTFSIPLICVSIFEIHTNYDIVAIIIKTIIFITLTIFIMSITKQRVFCEVIGIIKHATKKL